MKPPRPFRPRYDDEGAPSRPPRDGRPPREERMPGRRPTFFRAPSSDGVRSTGEEVEGTVKWFNLDKGFGFVELAGDRTAFLHASVLEARRRPPPHAGARLRGRLGEGPKGLQITEILEVVDAPPEGAGGEHGTRGEHEGRGERPLARGDARHAAKSPGVPMLGTVKWYDAERGFGFVGTDDGGSDVFLHAAVLKRIGMETMANGQRVMVLVGDGPKGREARAIAPVE
jgi:CspA family cold shock protein